MTEQTILRRLQRISAGFNRKARRYHVKGVCTPYILASKGDTCAYCPTRMELRHGTWDHKVPFDKGGTNDSENIVRCCTDCQRRKFTKTPEEYDEHRAMEVVCPIDGVRFKPRYAEAKRGMARYCSLSCAAKSRWL